MSGFNPISSGGSFSAILTVAADGSGDFSTLNDALAAVPSGGAIWMRRGIHTLTAPAAIPSYVSVLGEGESTIIRAPMIWSQVGGAMPMLRMQGVSGGPPVVGASLSNVVLDMQSSIRPASNHIPYHLLLNNCRSCEVDRVVFREGGYGALPVDRPTGPNLFMAAKDVALDLGDGGLTASPYPRVGLGPCDNCYVHHCRFEGNGTHQFAIRMVTDWGYKRLFADFVNLCSRNVVEQCFFTGDYGWNAIELAGGGTRNNVIEVNHFLDIQSLTCIDFDKGCNRNTADRNDIKGHRKPDYYLDDPSTRLASINDHGVGDTYLSEGNRITYNHIVGVDTPGSIDSYESAIAIAETRRSLCQGNTIKGVNPTAGNGNGIVLGDCENSSIKDNNIEGVVIGIRSDVNHTSRQFLAVEGNEIESAEQGIALSGTVPASGNGAKGWVIARNRCRSLSLVNSVYIVNPECVGAVIAGNQAIRGLTSYNIGASICAIIGNVSEGATVVAFRLGANAVLNGNVNRNAPNDIIYSGTPRISLKGNYFTNRRTLAASANLNVPDKLILLNAEAPVVITLVPAAVIDSDQLITIKRIDAGLGLATIVGSNGELIDDSNQYILGEDKCVTLQSTGAGYIVVGGN